MRKFLAVVRREYFKQVWTWAFVLATLAMPLLAGVFAVVPMMIFSIEGEAQRITVVDRSGKIAPRLRENLSPEKIKTKAREAARESLREIDASQEERMQLGAQQLGESFDFVDYDGGEKAVEEIRREMNSLIQQKRLDAYLIIPENFDAPDARFEYYSRNAGDFVTNTTLENALNEAVRSERLARANISEQQLRQLSEKVNLNIRKLSEKGEEKDDAGSFGAAFIIGLLIYITLAIYGQAIMSAVIEEKETRIAEILFSSARPFVLMMGKLVGVGLAGLTQLAIWLSSALLLMAFSAASLSAAGIPLSLPDVTPLSILYFFIFFLLGFFL
ncbi:MAG TPA: ABC transporter permease, partial [Pyrinomonadaceae bacterium]|nr:ABC transporter permease [Pyrinomonadaceae bacterium]